MPASDNIQGDGGTGQCLGHTLRAARRREASTDDALVSGRRGSRQRPVDSEGRAVDWLTMLAALILRVTIVNDLVKGDLGAVFAGGPGEDPPGPRCSTCAA